MILSLASWWTFAAGLSGLALLLLGLQFLRVRHRRVEVVTTLFWKEAMEESRARVLFPRFRHPWAYLLALAIVGLIWLAWAGPESREEVSEDTVFLLDGSGVMTVGNRFDESTMRLLRAVKTRSVARRRVFWAGGDLRLLLDRGEQVRLLTARLEGLRPEASPEGLARACLDLARQIGPRPTKIVLLGDSPVPAEIQRQFPEHLTLQRLGPEPEAGEEIVNRGIPAIGMASSESDYESVDVYFRTLGSPQGFQVQLDGRLYSETPEDLGGGRGMLRGVPAEGGELSLDLAEISDPFPLDDRAVLRLPRRERLRVRLESSVPETVVRLVQADPALEKVATNPDVIVMAGERGDGVPDAVPMLQWMSEDALEAAFTVVASEADVSVHTVFDALGLDQIDTTGLAQASGKEIRLQVQPGEVRAVRVWDRLLTEEYNLTRSAAFPLFIARSLRWLAGEEAVDPYVRVGEVHDDFTAGGVPYAPPRVGEYRGADGRTVWASLGGVGLSEVDEVARVASMERVSRGIDWVTWLVAAALLLLIGEWLLYKRGRLP